MVLAFQKQAWGDRELLRRKKIETLEFKNNKNSLLVHNQDSTCSPGPETGSRDLRQAGQKPSGNISGLAETVSCT